MGPLFEANIYFLTTKEGGRQHPSYDGYRPQLAYDGEEWDGMHRYPDDEWAWPGGTFRTLITVREPWRHPNLVPGKKFEIKEGPRVVGYGVVTKRLDGDIKNTL